MNKLVIALVAFCLAGFGLGRLSDYTNPKKMYDMSHVCFEEGVQSGKEQQYSLDGAANGVHPYTEQDIEARYKVPKECQ